MASAGTPYRLVPAHFYPCSVFIYSSTFSKTESEYRYRSLAGKAARLLRRQTYGYHPCQRLILISHFSLRPLCNLALLYATSLLNLLVYILYILIQWSNKRSCTSVGHYVLYPSWMTTGTYNDDATWSFLSRWPRISRFSFPTGSSRWSMITIVATVTLHRQKSLTNMTTVLFSHKKSKCCSK